MGLNSSWMVAAKLGSQKQCLIPAITRKLLVFLKGWSPNTKVQKKLCNMTQPLYAHTYVTFQLIQSLYTGTSCKKRSLKCQASEWEGHWM